MIDLQTIGNKIKQTRLMQKKTQQQIADACGISKSMLSKIENGQTAAAVATLSKICKALNIPMSWLLDEEKDRDLILVNKRSRKAKMGDHNIGYYYELLANKPPLSVIEPFIVSIPKELKKDQQTYTHTQDEFVYVLEGAIELYYDGKKYYMEKGDSAYFRGTKPHLYMPVNNQEAKVLTIYIENRFE